MQTILKTLEIITNQCNPYHRYCYKINILGSMRRIHNIVKQCTPITISSSIVYKNIAMKISENTASNIFLTLKSDTTTDKITLTDFISLLKMNGEEVESGIYDKQYIYNFHNADIKIGILEDNNTPPELGIFDYTYTPIVVVIKINRNYITYIKEAIEVIWNSIQSRFIKDQTSTKHTEYPIS